MIPRVLCATLILLSASAWEVSRGVTGNEDDEDDKDDDCEKEPGVRGSVDRRSSGEEGWSVGEGKRREGKRREEGRGKEGGGKEGGEKEGRGGGPKNGKNP